MTHRQSTKRSAEKSNLPRHKPRHRHRGFAGCILASLVFAAAGFFAALTSDRAVAADTPKQLVVGDLFVLQTLDPGRTIESTSLMINKVTYDTLVTYAGSDVRTILPALATDWTISDDGLTYTFNLRSDVKFTSGNPLTAADAKWSLDRIINLQATTKLYVKGITKVEAPNPTTLVLHLEHPDPSLLAKLTTPAVAVLDRKVVMENGGDASADASSKDKAEAYLNTHSAGSGPFILESYVPGQEVVLVKNPDYWRGPAKVDRIVVRNVIESTTRELLIKKGDIDVALNISQDQVESLRQAGVTVKSSPIAMIFYLQLNRDPEIGGDFANPLVQQAIRYAVDYEGLMAIAGAGATPLASLMPSIFPGALDPADAYKTDLDKAKALLAEANVENATAEMLFYQSLTVNGIPIDLLAQKIQADLAAVGLNIVLGGKPNALARTQWRGGKAPVGLFIWISDYADPSNYMGFLPGGTVGARAKWTPESSPEAKKLAELGELAQRELDPRKRVELYEEVERELVKIGPFVPLFQPSAPIAYGPDIEGANFHSVWLMDFYTVSKSK